MRRVYALSAFIPVAIVLEIANAPDTAVFFAAALGIVPTAQLMSDATEALAARSGPGIGGLLNVTFGNAPELIIAIFALGQGLQEVVKASLVGSVIGNALLVLGFAMGAGGLKRGEQAFNRDHARVQSLTLLAVGAVLVVPTVVRALAGGSLPGIEEHRHHFPGGLEAVALAVAVVLVLVYAWELARSVRSRTGRFEPVPEEVQPEGGVWSVRRSVVLLAVGAVLVGVMSDVLVHSILGASRSIGLSPFFIGVFVVGIVGNAAEHWVAVVVAIKDQMDLALNIALGSSVQIAMLVTPLLVLLSFLVGPHPMALVFNGYEVAALLAAGVMALLVTLGPRSTWRQGAALLGVYAAFGVVIELA